MKVRLAILAGGIALLSLVGAATASATPSATTTASNGRVACVAVQQANLGVCISNPLNDLP
jgi:hypothetical protein